MNNIIIYIKKIQIAENEIFIVRLNLFVLFLLLRINSY